MYSQKGAIRELEEEVNLSCKVSDLRHLGKKSKNKHYFLALNWTGKINVDKPNPKTKQIEHDDWRWSTINDIKDIEDTNIPIYLLEKALEMSKNE